MQSATAWLRPARRVRATLGLLALALLVPLDGCAEGPAPAPTPTPVPPVTVPVLGAPIGRSSQGFGAVRPRVVSGGGDPTSTVDGITWRSWGGATARGTGTGCFVPQGAPISACVRERVEVVASGLGTCAGVRAYEDFGWYFPGESQHFDPDADFYIRGCVFRLTT